MDVFQVVKKMATEFEPSIPQKVATPEQMLVLIRNFLAPSRNYVLVLISIPEGTKLEGELVVTSYEELSWNDGFPIRGRLLRNQRIFLREIHVEEC